MQVHALQAVASPDGQLEVGHRRAQDGVLLVGVALAALVVELAHAGLGVPQEAARAIVARLGVDDQPEAGHGPGRVLPVHVQQAEVHQRAGVRRQLTLEEAVVQRQGVVVGAEELEQAGQAEGGLGEVDVGVDGALERGNGRVPIARELGGEALSERDLGFTLELAAGLLEAVAVATLEEQIDEGDARLRTDARRTRDRAQGVERLGGTTQLGQGLATQQARQVVARRLQVGQGLGRFARGVVTQTQLLVVTVLERVHHPVAQGLAPVVRLGRLFAEAEPAGPVPRRLLDDLSFEAPDMPASRIEIDKAMVQERLGELVEDQDLSQYIL